MSEELEQAVYTFLKEGGKKEHAQSKGENTIEIEKKIDSYSTSFVLITQPYVLNGTSLQLEII